MLSKKWEHKIQDYVKATYHSDYHMIMLVCEREHQVNSIDSNQRSSDVVCAKAQYSPYVLEWATRDCFLELQK